MNWGLYMDELGPQERAVLGAIKANPFVSQQEMADALGLARSTIAAHIVQLTRKGYLLGRGYVVAEPGRAVCIGGAVLDRKFRAHAPLVPATSNPVDGFRSLGGVARNVAENIAKLGTETSFISIVGNDETGREITGAMRQRGIDVSQMIVTDAAPTAEYLALLGPDNELSVAAADMRIFDLFTPDLLDRIWPHLAAATWVFADCNLPAVTLAALIDRKRSARFRLAIDAVSTPKVTRLPRDLTGVDLLFLNLDEAQSFLALGPIDPDLCTTAVPAALNMRFSPEAAVRLLRAAGARDVIITLGAQGAVYASETGQGTIASVAAAPLDITGAGDAMIAATIHRIMAGDTLPAAAQMGALLAALTTETEATVHPALSPTFRESHRHRLPPQQPEPEPTHVDAEA